MDDLPVTRAANNPSFVEEPGERGKVIACLSLVFYGAMVAAAGIWRGIPPISSDRLIPGVLAALVISFLTVGLGAAGTRAFGWVRALEEEFRVMLGRLSPRVIAVVALTSGIGEEVFFRGALQPFLVEALESPIAGYSVASSIFGAIHFVPRRSFLPWTAFAVAMGFVLGGLFLWTGSILPPIVVHVTVNYLNLTRICRGGGGFPRVEVQPTHGPE